MARMMAYAYQDTDSKAGEDKFGDHYVPDNCTLDEAIQHTLKYMRTQFPRRTIHFDSDKVKKHIWDVSDYAKKHKKFYPHSHIDDVIRPAIGSPGITGREFHTCKFDNLIIRVNKELAKLGQPLPKVRLSRAQCQSGEQTLKMFADGKTTIVAELCARLGKTIWGGVIAKELDDTNLIIVASYVLTVFTSFEKDLTSFDQFSHFKHVDLKNKDYKKQIDTYLKNGEKVIAYLSMSKCSNRDIKIKYLFGKRANRLLIIDEADLGVHCPGQARALINARKKNDKVILMTGTNADRAVSEWPIDGYIGITYPELVINKHQAKKYNTSLKYFKHDVIRDKLVVDVEFYQMGLSEVVASVNKKWLNQDELPSWSKWAASPIKAKGFFINMLESVFLGKHGIDSVNMDFQIETVSAEALPETRVAMMFFPGNMRNDALTQAEQHARQALPGFTVEALHGGNKVTNRKAEAIARAAIDRAKTEGKNVLFLTAGMAQRSFSVPEITDLFLAYDGGDNAATIQKMSRTLTPGKLGKVGRIWSLSFDPNRDDKFDTIVLETAKNYMQTRDIQSLKEAMRDVLRTINIFDCAADGAVELKIDAYLAQAHGRKSISRVIGKITNLSLLCPEDIAALAAGNGDYFRAARQEAAKKGRTKNKVPQKKKQGIAKPATNSQMKKAREMVVTIVENMDIIIYGVNAHSVDSAFELLRNLPDRRRLEMLADIEAEFGISFDLIAYLFESGAINEGFIELLFDV